MPHAHAVRRVIRRIALVPVIVLVSGTAAGDPSPTSAPAPPFVVEYYYKVRWGYFDEFFELYQRNHYPVLERQRRLGRIRAMSATFPVNHASESSRWDMRFTIVWKDAATAHDGFSPAAIVRELYPDSLKFRREEQRRFELLLEHVDIPVYVDSLTEWRK